LGEWGAELNELLKKVANLGIEGAAKYQASEWQGVLQQDLAGQLNNSRNCKLEVYKDLKDKFLAQSRSSIEKGYESSNAAERAEAIRNAFETVAVFGVRLEPDWSLVSETDKRASDTILRFWR
jgi:hypothetical protein